jgi:protein-tyrosine phosphatase
MAPPITHVNVTRLDGDLVVTWRGGGDVTVFVSADPDDAGVDVRVPDRPGVAVIERGVGFRPYIHLFDPEFGFEVAADRHIELDGPRNFRDLGGYATGAKGRTRWGRVFRSDRLDGLTDRDHDVIEMLGVDVVFDLRSPAETDAAPDRLPAALERVHLPLSSDEIRARPMLQRIIDGDLTSYSNDDMVAGYMRILGSFGPSFAAVVERVAAGATVVAHCTAGKDRTGLVAMLMLGLAGVEDGDLLDDYEISDRYRDSGSRDAYAEQVRRIGHDPDAFAAMFGSPRSVMRETVTGLRRQWGSIEGYLSHAGVSSSVLEAARSALVADHGT